MATLNGGEGNDTITGTSGNDSINGRDGNDRIIGLIGNDTIYAGAGIDTVYGGSGNDQLYGGDGHDSIYGEDGNDEITIRNGAIVDSGTGADTVYAYGADTVSTGDGNDEVRVFKLENYELLNDTNNILLGAGDDYLEIHGFSEASYAPNINGGTGNDTLHLTSLRNGISLAGITGIEKIEAFNNVGRIVLSETNVPFGTTLTFTGIGGSGEITNFDGSAAAGNLIIECHFWGYNSNKASGGRGNDTIKGGSLNDLLSGNGGNDSIIGLSGTDTITAGSGDDVIDGGDGVDTAIYSGSYADYTMSEITYNQFLIQDNTGADGTDTIIDVNRLEFTDQTVSVVIRGMEIIGDETDEELSGGNSADHVDGAGGDDTLSGLGGHDSIDGGDGSDTLIGNVGNDFLNGDADDDSISGGTGNDSVDGGIGNDTLYSADGDDTVLGGEGADLIVGGDGKGNDRYIGGIGSDTVKYTSAQNAININLTTGLAGSVGGGDLAGIGSDRLSSIENVISGRYSDRITGNGSANTLNAGAGNDTIDGGAGKDQLIGGIGRDVMTGGTAADTFVFSHVNQSSTTNSTCDVIKDFVHGVDKINLRAIDAFSGTPSTNENFTWNTGPSFNSTSQGEVRFKQFNNDGTGNDYTMIYIDTDGDVGAEMLIRLTGLHSLTASDFIL